MSDRGVGCVTLSALVRQSCSQEIVFFFFFDWLNVLLMAADASQVKVLGAKVLLVLRSSDAVVGFRSPI